MVTSTAATVVTSTAEDKRPSQIEKDQPRKNSTVVTEAENPVTKTFPPKPETSEPPPPPVTKKEVISSDETKPSVKVIIFLRLKKLSWSIVEKNSSKGNANCKLFYILLYSILAIFFMIVIPTYLVICRKKFVKLKC